MYQVNICAQQELLSSAGFGSVTPPRSAAAAERALAQLCRVSRTTVRSGQHRFSWRSVSDRQLKRC